MGRCYSPGHTVYKWYGGAGITVCPDWHDFMQFQAEMGNRPPGLTLDRKDPKGPYCKENCRWATMVEQNRNRTNNRHVTFGGETKTLAEWAELLEMPYKTLHPVQDAASTPHSLPLDAGTSVHRARPLSRAEQGEAQWLKQTRSTPWSRP